MFDGSFERRQPDPEKRTSWFEQMLRRPNADPAQVRARTSDALVSPGSYSLLTSQRENTAAATRYFRNAVDALNND